MITFLLRIFVFCFCILVGATGKASSDSNSSTSLSSFEKAELRRLLDLGISGLSQVPVQGVLGFEQEYWRNPASVHVIRPEDITLNGYLNSVEALRGVPGMHVSRGLAYDNFASMRNFSGFATQKFLGKIGGREVSQLMLGSANYSVDDYPVAVIDRIEVIRGPGASIWGTNAVNGVLNLVTKHAGDTQGDSLRLAIQDNGTFMGDYVHGGKISEDSFYRVWVRDQEYAEGTLDSGSPARDDGHLRKAGFRFDKNLGSDLNLYVAGGFATRRVEHVLDLSARLLYQNSILPEYPEFIPLSYIQSVEPFLFASPLLSDGSENLLEGVSLNLPSTPPSWSSIASGNINFGDSQITRFEQYGELTNDSGHVVARLDGITDSDLEWSLTGAVEHTEISLGHIGFDWDQTQFDLGFDANRPLGDFHRLSFGMAARRTNLDVRSTVIEPFAFSSLINPTYLVPPSNPFDPTSSSSSVPVLSYNQEFTEIDRFTAYIQDSISLTDKIEVSVGTKFEENDLAGTGFQPGIRASWLANDSNVLWASYSKAHRQPSLRERYTTLTPAKVWIPNPLLPGGGIWSNIQLEGDESLDREEIDSFELGWRSRPSENLLLEISSYYYDTKNAVLASQTSVNAYEAKDAEAYGGELSIDWRASDLWRLRGGYSLARGKVDGVRVYDFPENTASLSSHFKYSDEVTLIQNLFYSGETKIPSDYNPITIPSHLRLDLGIVWQIKGDWEIGLFGRDLLESYHVETMYPGVDVEPARVERTFILTLLKKF
ncbi:TonB-dependent receptor [Opitutales bacterium]|nr:TonB-dependent receptor [Opitutales bacterium]